MPKEREHINLRAARAGNLLDGFTLTVEHVNGLPDSEALIGQELDAALEALKAEGWTLIAPAPRAMGGADHERVHLYRDVEQKRTLPPPPTLAELEARDKAREAEQLAARKATRALRERFGDREPTPEELATLSAEDRARLAALRVTQQGLGNKKRARGTFRARNQ